MPSNLPQELLRENLPCFGCLPGPPQGLPGTSQGPPKDPQEPPRDVQGPWGSPLGPGGALWGPTILIRIVFYPKQPISKVLRPQRCKNKIEWIPHRHPPSIMFIKRQPYSKKDTSWPGIFPRRIREAPIPSPCLYRYIYIYIYICILCKVGAICRRRHIASD